jgi:uncharacterized Ntn-hydrolase superfamily protein
MTLSLAGLCQRTGMLGTAIASPSLAIGSRAAFARAGIGAVLVQHRSDPRLGEYGLDFLAQGKDAAAALNALVVAAAPNHSWRQLAIIDRAGRTAHFSGGEIVSVHGAATRTGVVAIGNRLASSAVPQHIVDGFAEDTRPDLAERLLRGLEAGLASGGCSAPLRSAALYVVHRDLFARVDLRIDDDDAPLAALRRLWQAFAPQVEEFVSRAVAPARADPAPR